MNENIDNNIPYQDSDSQGQRIDYLKRAAAADESGDALLSMYLYLAAFQQATKTSDTPSEEAVSGLKQAWALACANKERSLAEYIFELLEPYLSADEINLCADELQKLALDKLEEFGLPREELENMANMISDDLLGLGDSIVKMDGLFPPFNPLSLKINRDVSSDLAKRDQGLDNKLANVDPSGDTLANIPGPNANDITADADIIEPSAEFMDTESAIRTIFGEDPMNFDTIAGYSNAIKTMRDLGIGMDKNKEFKEFVDMLNARHGLDKMPALDTIVLRSPAREDANRFMVATLGELKLPMIHMRMEENYQGMPVLCVSAHSIDIPKNNSLRDVFTDGGVLVLEDLDMWNAPMSDLGDDSNAFFMMQLTRGAREAVNLISSAVNNPDVYVLVTTSTKGNIDPFFLDLLEPMSIIDIDFPTPEERVEIWMDISSAHPSIGAINKADLVRLSANMPRFDIYMAAREAIEEAYKLGLMSRRYQPVTRDNLFDKLAAYQPLDSNEYSELENAVIDDFKIDLLHIDDLLKDE